MGATLKKNGMADWFPDGELNVGYLALDAQVEAGRGEQTALIYDSPVTGNVQTYRYRELLDEVASLLGLFSRWGLVRAIG